MNSRFHDNMAGIALLTMIMIVSIAEVIFRIVAVRELSLSTPNLGEQISMFVLALIMIGLTVKGKDRVCYILYLVLLGHFILDQFLEFPGVIITLINLVSEYGMDPHYMTVILTALNMITIITIGALLVEYLNDKSIYNRAFNILCIATVLIILAKIIIDVYSTVTMGYIGGVLAIFESISRLIMVFLFTFFAYDSAKKQLRKVDLSE